MRSYYLYNLYSGKSPSGNRGSHSWQSALAYGVTILTKAATLVWHQLSNFSDPLKLAPTFSTL